MIDLTDECGAVLRYVEGVQAKHPSEDGTDRFVLGVAFVELARRVGLTVDEACAEIQHHYGMAEDAGDLPARLRLH